MGFREQILRRRNKTENIACRAANRSRNLRCRHSAQITHSISSFASRLRALAILRGYDLFDIRLRYQGPDLTALRQAMWFGEFQRLSLTRCGPVLPVPLG